MRLALVLTTLTAAQGWTPNARNVQNPLETALRWAASDADADSDRGLGGGLSYAVDRDFCAKMLPRVADDLWTGAHVLVDCAAVHAAVARAFRIWEVNHPSIRFVDVSSRACAPHNAAVDGGDHKLEPYGAVAAADDDCVLAEIIVRAPIGHANFNDMAHSIVDTLNETHALAYAEIVPASTASVRMTDGRRAEEGVEIARVQITVNTQQLWLLDGQFCVPYDWSGRLGFELGWAVAAIAGWIGLCSQARRTLAAPRARASAERIGLGWRLLWLGILGLLFSVPPLFHSLALAPCARGADFELVVAHEIGHALGLGHPQDGAALGHNYRLPLHPPRPVPDECFDDARLLSSNVHASDSVLDSYAPHARGYCLSADEVEGLRWLYPPQCGLPLKRVADAEVICPTDRAPIIGRYRVLVALGLAIGAAAAFAALASVLLSALARASDRWRAHRSASDKAAADVAAGAPEAGAPAATQPTATSAAPRSLLSALVGLVRGAQPEAPAPMVAQRLSHASIAAATTAATSVSGARPLAPWSRGGTREPSAKRQGSYDAASVTSLGDSDCSSFTLRGVAEAAESFVSPAGASRV